MKYIITMPIFLILAVQCLNAQTQLDTFFETANHFFAKHITDGTIDFDDIETATSLTNLVELIKEVDISEADSLNQAAFLINAYNLHALNEIKKLLPLNHTVYYDDFFHKTVIEIAGDKLSLNQLRNDRLAFISSNPLFHFVLIQAGLSFPMLPDFAFMPNLLNEQLDAQTRKVINHPNFLKQEGEILTLPQFLKWYKKDLLAQKHSIISFINQYSNFDSEKLKLVRKIKLDKAKHWTLNYYLQSITINADTTKTKKQFKRQFNKYVPAALISSGSIEIKLLNNLTKNEPRNQPNRQYSRQSLQAKIGINKSLNLGFLFNYNRDYPEVNSLSPRIWFMPLKDQQNFVFEFGLTFPSINYNESGFIRGVNVKNNGYSIHSKIKYWQKLFKSFYFDVNIGLTMINHKMYVYNYYMYNTIYVPINLSYQVYFGKRLRLHTTFHYSPYKGKSSDSTIKGNTTFNQTGLSYQCSKKTEIAMLYGFFKNKFNITSKGRFPSGENKWRDLNLNLRFSF